MGLGACAGGSAGKRMASRSGASNLSTVVQPKISNGVEWMTWQEAIGRCRTTGPPPRAEAPESGKVSTTTMSSSPPAHSFSKRCNEYMVNYINDQRGRGVIVGPETEQFVVAMIDGLGRMLDSGRILDKGTRVACTERASLTRVRHWRAGHRGRRSQQRHPRPSREVPPGAQERLQGRRGRGAVRRDYRP